MVCDPTPDDLGERVAGVTGDVEVLMPLEGAVDLDKERERLQKALAKVEGELAGLDARLANDGFVNNAPEAVVHFCGGAFVGASPQITYGLFLERLTRLATRHDDREEREYVPYQRASRRLRV